jgi:hypothetical protein
MRVNQLALNKVELSFDRTVVLFSYNVPVAARIVNMIGGWDYFYTEKHWSATTSKHIKNWIGHADAIMKPQEFFDNLLNG